METFHKLSISKTKSLQTFKKVEFKIKWRCKIVVIDIISGVIIIIKYHQGGAKGTNPVLILYTFYLQNFLVAFK